MNEVIKRDSKVTLEIIDESEMLAVLNEGSAITIDFDGESTIIRKLVLTSIILY
jgi:hypothetical protein